VFGPLSFFRELFTSSTNVIFILKSDFLGDRFNLDFSLEANRVDLGDGPGLDSPDKVQQSVEILSSNSYSCFFSLLVTNIYFKFVSFPLLQ
jgi:hypothetical protein